MRILSALSSINATLLSPSFSIMLSEDGGGTEDVVVSNLSAKSQALIFQRMVSTLLPFVHRHFAAIAAHLDQQPVRSACAGSESIFVPIACGGPMCTRHVARGSVPSILPRLAPTRLTRNVPLFSSCQCPKPSNFFIVRYNGTSESHVGRGLQLHKDDTKLTFNCTLSDVGCYAGGGTYLCGTHSH